MVSLINNTIDRFTNPEFVLALATLVTAAGALIRACQTRKEVRKLRRELNGNSR